MKFDILYVRPMSQKEIEKMFIEEFFKIINEERNGDVVVTQKSADDKQELLLYIAGVKKEDISILVNSNIFTVEAKQRVGYNNWKYKNSWRLGRELDTENITSSYVDGVLTVIFPKKNIETSKKIHIA